MPNPFFNFDLGTGEAGKISPKVVFGSKKIGFIDLLPYLKEGDFCLSRDESLPRTLSVGSRFIGRPRAPSPPRAFPAANPAALATMPAARKLIAPTTDDISVVFATATNAFKIRHNFAAFPQRLAAVRASLAGMAWRGGTRRRFNESLDHEPRFAPRTSPGRNPTRSGMALLRPLLALANSPG
jgi:hypothetical protein